MRYAVPAALIAGKQKITLRFQASPGAEIAAVYGIRSIRSALADEIAATPAPATSP